MADYNGVPWNDPFVQASEALEHSTTKERDSGPAQKTTQFVEDTGEERQFVLARQTTGNWAFTNVRRTGVLPYSAGRDLIFDRVWVEPSLIEAGFITEELTYSISIWNAWIDRSVEFTSMSSVNPDGTSLPTGTLPLNISQSDDLVLTLTIDQTGPPVQNTTYSPLIDGVTHEIEITGLRVLGLTPEPNWGAGLQLTYNFRTAMYQTPRFEEQRRPLLDKPYRKERANFLLSATEAHKFFYVISYAHDKVFGVPIYNEMMLASSIPNGGTTITTLTDTSTMYNLNNLSTHVAIVDHGSGTSEIKEVDSIGANSIDVTQAISGTFDTDTTRIYPVFFALVSSLRKSHATDDVEQIEAEFEEFNNG